MSTAIGVHLAQRLARALPFLSWFPISALAMRADLIAGITGALVLIPKAMAYAQLSGLPVYFGLYVAFVPAILGALWGSSRQLATGPVAIVSLMTAAALTPLAVPFSAEYIELALLLTLMVGLIQFTMGALKLGTIVNFVSHPAILGFMNAAAIIIALSQLDMLLGIPKPRSDSFIADVWEMLGLLPLTHLPTLAMSAFALVLMLALKSIPLVSKPSVLIAVAVTIVVSAAIGFERKAGGYSEDLADTRTREQVQAYAATSERIRALQAELPGKTSALRKLEGGDPRALAALRHQIHLIQLDAADLADENRDRLRAINRLRFERARPDAEGRAALYLPGQVPEGTEIDGRRWRIRSVDNGRIALVGGGDVVGTITPGLPALRLPTISFEALLSLLSAALVIAMVGFMESIAMAKALSATTRQRIDPNQELIGQGVANLGGAFFQSYPACGSFTGSAINLQAGAKTGFAMVFNGLFVAATLLFFTPLLYHLPKATLAVIILLAVGTLLTPAALRQTWRASRTDGMVAATTFVVTLVAAPHLDKGILTGAGLAVLLYLYRTMRPRVAQLGRHADGTLRDLRVYPNLPTSADVIALRFDDSLYFANAHFFEEAVLEAVAAKPGVKFLLVAGSGINQIDASGEEVVRHLVEHLREGGVTVVFAGLKKQVLDVLKRTGLYEIVGERHFFANEDRALVAIDDWLGGGGKNELLAPEAGAYPPARAGS